jgi:hypothetical protein
MNKMNKMVTILFAMSIILAGTASIFSADRTTKKYDYKDFSKVEAGSGMLLDINKSSSYSITVNADEEDFEYLKVEKSGNTLRFYIDKNNYHRHGVIRISINLPSLTGIGLSGGAQGKLSMNTEENFDGELSGGAEISGSLSCRDINLEISGGSVVNLSGKAADLTADASGGSIYHLKDFSVKNVNVDLSGGSRLETTMNGTLDVNASGGSRVVYYGNAKPGSTDFSGGSGISQGE